MAACARCGREFTPRTDLSIPRVFLLLTSYPLRNPFGYFAIAFVIGGVVTLGFRAGSALADRDFSLQTLSLSVLFAVLLLFMLGLIRSWLQSRVYARYCPDCAIDTRRPVFSTWKNP